MKRASAVVTRPASHAAVRWTLLLWLVSGCSDSNSVPPIHRPGGLTRAEYKALKNAHKNPRELDEAIRKIELEKMVKEGVVVETRPGNKPKKAGRGLR